MEDSGGFGGGGGGGRGGGGRGRGTSTRDWTKGSLLGNLFGLAWPMMITQALSTLGPTIDMIWVGKLGAASIAGVGIWGMLVQLVSVGRMGPLRPTMPRS